MADQNNKGYDEFSKSEQSKRFDSEAGHEEGSDHEKNVKPSYYYSYGPISNENSLASPAGGSTNHDNVAMEGKLPVMQPSQLRTFTTSGTANQSPFLVREKKGSSFKSIFLSFLAGVLVVGGLMYTADVRNWFTGGDAITGTQSGGNGSGAIAGKTVSSHSSASSSIVAARPNNIAQLFHTASPAVVKIETFVKAQSGRGGGSILDDPFFRQFFGDHYPRTIPRGQSGEMQQSGIGTGFFFEASGYILTNQHVIGESDEIRVTVQGHDKPFTAKLLGSSYDLDLAVIKIEGKEAFPTLAIGSSDDINIGDWVVAIGNPYGFDHTITVGVLSAKERPIDIQDRQGTRSYKHLLQTDASINPGNSGGPLLNLNGEVIGMNTAVSSQAQGIGFAIPTSTINEVLDSLKNNKEVPKEPAPFIGADLYPMTEEFAKQLGINNAEGSLVKSVYYNSPAYLADLKQFDVIIGVEGKRRSTTNALIKDIQSRSIGEKVEFNIIRQGKEMNVIVEIGDKNVFGLE